MGAVSQINNTGAPEATAWVTLALFVAQSPLYKIALEDLNQVLERMKDSINSNFTLSLIVSILCEVDPQNSFIPLFCNKLLESAFEEDKKIKFWCSKCKDICVSKIEPSIVHTASAIIALYNSQRKGAISIDLHEKLADTRELLLNKKLWKNTREAISIQIGAKEDSLIVDYYTIAWVLKALLIMDEFVDYSIIQDAMEQILSDYEDGYWKYEGYYYIWAMYDALTALETYWASR